MYTGQGNHIYSCISSYKDTDYKILKVDFHGYIPFLLPVSDEHADLQEDEDEPEVEGEEEVIHDQVSREPRNHPCLHW